MDKVLKKVSLFLLNWWRDFAGSFTIGIIFLSLANAFFVANYQPERQGISPLLPAISGLPYTLIFQVICLMLILCFLNVLFRSEIIIVKMRYFYRNLLLVFLAIVISLIFILKYNWVPENENWRIISGLLLGIVLLTICFFIENKLKTKQYNKLLENFKEKRQKDNVE